MTKRVKTEEGGPWFVRGYYSREVRSPRKPGALAYQSTHKTKQSRDFDVAMSKKRDDIGRIEHGPVGGPVCVEVER